MDKKVEAFLRKKRKASAKQYETEKKAVLDELGLYVKEYSPDNKYSEEFSLYDRDENRETKYYKKVYCDVTDEEYQEIKKYSKRKEDIKTNSVAKALTVIAWFVYISGFIAGIALGTVEVERGTYYTYTDTEFSFTIAFIYWCVSFVSGTIFLGFAEIIKLLDAIEKK